jgi:hypothetical protein
VKKKDRFLCLNYGLFVVYSQKKNDNKCSFIRALVYTNKRQIFGPLLQRKMVFLVDIYVLYNQKETDIKCSFFPPKILTLRGLKS